MGWLHDTLTIKGGWLATKDFTTSSSALPMSRYLSSGLDNGATAENREMCFEWYSRCLEGSLNNHHALEAICAWIQSTKRIIELGNTPTKWSPKWFKRIEGIWGDFLDLRQDLPKACPCGKTSESFIPHFRAVHLSMLPQSKKRKRRITRNN